MGGLPGAMFQAKVEHALSPVSADTFTPADAVPARPEPEEGAWVLNTATKKFHRMFCLSAVQMDDGKRKIFEGSREELLDMGYEPCSWCGEIDTE